MLDIGFPSHWSTLKKLVFLKKTPIVPALPSGYTQLRGIRFDANVYYEITGFKLKGSDKLRFSFSTGVACNVLGCYTNGSAQTNYSLYVTVSSGKYLRYNGGTYNSVIDANKKYDVVITPTGSHGMKSDETWEQKDFTAASDMCIGTTSTSASSSKLNGVMYGPVIVDGRFRGIPCKRSSDNAIGYYDTYSETFYEKKGSGTPAAYTG